MSLIDMFRLDGKVAVVTGASSGLGVAFARGLAEAGADLALGARRADRLADTASLVERAGRRALTVATDVADPESCTNLVALAVEEFGRKHAGRVKVVRLNIDDAPGIADRHNVRGIPTLLVMQNGREVDRLTGAARKPDLMAWLERHLGTPAAT